jgi:L-fuconolactonase
MIVDSHQHFWRYDAQEYGWIGDDLAAIRRDFLPGDLAREIAAAGVDAVVSVQARQSLEETRWLLELAAENEFIAGVVGWVPLVSPWAGGRTSSARCRGWSPRPTPGPGRAPRSSPTSRSCWRRSLPRG